MDKEYSFPQAVLEQLNNNVKKKKRPQLSHTATTTTKLKMDYN